jgi:hypothetical protein
MDTNNAPQQPISSGDWPQKQGQVGPIIGIIIIVIVLALGGLYVWGARLNRADTNNTETGPGNQSAQDISTAGDPALDNLKTQGTSDELDAICDDLEPTSLDGHDTEMKSINTELP